MKNPVLSAFDKNWADLRKKLNRNVLTMPIMTVMPGKAEVRKCLANAAYAKIEHEHLESMGVFEFIAHLVGAEKDAVLYLILKRRGAKTNHKGMTAEDMKRFISELSF